MKQRMFIDVQGNRHRWTFPFMGDPAQLAEWRADGLEVNEVYATIPALAVNAGLLRPWIAVQRAWRWLRCF
jgi:hypothetical protein